MDQPWTLACHSTASQNRYVKDWKSQANDECFRTTKIPHESWFTLFLLVRGFLLWWLFWDRCRERTSHMLGVVLYRWDTWNKGPRNLLQMNHMQGYMSAECWGVGWGAGCLWGQTHLKHQNAVHPWIWISWCSTPTGSLTSPLPTNSLLLLLSWKLSCLIIMEFQDGNMNFKPVLYITRKVT